MKKISEVERLSQRLAAMNCTNFHVDAEPGATAEEVAREVNRALDDIEAGLTEEVPLLDSGVPQIDVRDLLT